MRVGLVLGAGGVLGGAWLTGGLDALTRETGWDPGTRGLHRRHLGRLDGRRRCWPPACRPGSWSPTRAGETFTGLVGRRRPARRPRPTAPRAPRSASTAALPPIGSGLAAHGVPARSRTRCAAHAARSWWPAGCRAGIISTDAAEGHGPAGGAAALGRPPELLGRGLRLPHRPAHPVRAGRRSPPAEVADAVAASCAIPGFYRPVKIGGRRYVDGGCARPRTSTCSPGAASTS